MVAVAYKDDRILPSSDVLGMLTGVLYYALENIKSYENLLQMNSS